jgi:hypothetical protein
MDIWKRLKKLRRKGAAKVNAEASTSHVERAIVVRWGNTATVKRTPLRERERGIDE